MNAQVPSGTTGAKISGSDAGLATLESDGEVPVPGCTE
jgi:hypothetical protein